MDIQPSDSDRRQTRRLAATAVALAFFFYLLSRGVGESYSVFLLPLGRELGWSRSALTGVFSLYLAVSGITAAIMGMLFDRFGPRFVYSLGLGSLGGGWFLAGFIEQVWQLYACLGILGGAGVTALGMVSGASLIGRWHHKRLTTAMAIAYTGSGCGLLALVPLCQFILDNFGWRNCFHLVGGGVLAICAAIQLLPWRALKAGHPAHPSKVRGQHGSPAAWTLARALRVPEFWYMAQVFFFTAVGMYIVLVQVVPFLVERGFSSMESASAFGLQGMLSVFGIISAGWMVDRLGHRGVATLTFVGTGLGIVALLALAYWKAGWLVTAYVLAFGLGQGGRGPIVSSLCARRFAGAGQATIQGALFSGAWVGSAVGALCAGVLHDLTGGYVASFVVAIIAVLLGGIPFWLPHGLGSPSSPHARDTPETRR
ncbi:MAG TPA: MFS transporter [Rhodocyclaceae bacterium]|nr:MFS transporter [Rhodocyclaceae bacterium]